MIRSFVYLLGLYFVRFIPLKIFWGLYSLGERLKIQIGPKLLFLLIPASYGVSLLALFFILLAGLNFSFAHNLQLVWVPLLAEPGNPANFDSGKLDYRYYSFLLSPLLCRKILAIPLKIVFQMLAYLALIATGFGAAEISNDYSSHLNPDFFDLLFPANGAVLFYGGLALFILTGFFLYFLLPVRNLRKWKRRMETSSRFSPGYRNWIVSPALLHPYFFLSPGAKNFCAQHAVDPKIISLLFNIALVENRDIIPFEWLKKNLPPGSGNPEQR